MLSFSPLDILYIVLSFCALWLTAALFWLVFQVATTFRNFNRTLAEAREKMEKIEIALQGIKKKFEHTTSLFGLVVESATKLVAHTIETKVKQRAAKKSAKK